MRRLSIDPALFMRLIGHARAHGAVADHGDDVVLAPFQVPRHGHAQGRRNGRRAVGGAEGVVFAFVALGETREPAALAQGADAVPPAGQDLVGIGLMADIPDQPIRGVSKR